MPGPLLYSTNPWFSSEVAQRFRGGIHFAWVCECFDSAVAAQGTAAAAIAPSSNPRRIYEQLLDDCHLEDKHSTLIEGYKRTFKLLAKTWLSTNTINQNQFEEITAIVKSVSWRVWRPVLYVIPRKPIEDAQRLISIPSKDRAGYGPEQQIVDLARSEFDIIELGRRNT